MKKIKKFCHLFIINLITKNNLIQYLILNNQKQIVIAIL